MVWEKTIHNKARSKIGLGFYTRQCCEYVLLGTRGSTLRYKNPEFRAPVVNIFKKDTKRHSQKPRYLRRLIDRMFCNVPKAELFARDNSHSKWWDHWGNEVPPPVQDEDWIRRRKHQIHIYKQRSLITNAAPRRTKKANHE